MKCSDACASISKNSPMLDKELITRKLSRIKRYIAELEPLVQLGEQALARDSIKCYAAERLFQLIVDAMIDINTHIIRGRVLPPPDDLQSTFITLSDADILPKRFAQKLAPIVGLRNAVVHRYETVSVERFIHELVLDFSDFKTYATAIAAKFLV